METFPCSAADGRQCTTASGSGAMRERLAKQGKKERCAWRTSVAPTRGELDCRDQACRVNEPLKGSASWGFGRLQNQLTIRTGKKRSATMVFQAVSKRRRRAEPSRVVQRAGVSSRTKAENAHSRLVGWFSNRGKRWRCISRNRLKHQVFLVHRALSALRRREFGS